MSDTPTQQGAPAPIALPPLPGWVTDAAKPHIAKAMQDYARTHEANVCAAIGGEVERLRNALARVVDTDWAYLGHDADTANPDSLYNRVRDGRKALGGAR